MHVFIMFIQNFGLHSFFYKFLKKLTDLIVARYYRDSILENYRDSDSSTIAQPELYSVLLMLFILSV